MSISFGDLNLNNGLASRLLRAIGYEVSEESSGSMGVSAMLVGIEAAKAIVEPEDAEYLGYLEEELLAAKARGVTTFEWF